MAFDPWEAVVYAGSIGFILCLLPQLFKTLRTGKAEDLSWGFLVLVLLSSSLTLPYMLHRNEVVFAVSQAVNLGVWGTVAMVKFVSGRPGTRAKLDAPRVLRGAMEGKKLPAVTFLDHEGKTLKSSELETPAVLYFYPKDDTPGCTAEACGIRDQWGAFEEAGLHVYGVSKDDAKSHQRFIAKFSLPFPLLTADEAALEKLGAWQEKSMYGKTYMGIQRMTYLIGADGKVLKAYPKVKPEEHADELLADFEQLA